MNSAPLKIKIAFWLMLGILSVFFAEVIAGSSIYPFFTPVGWIVVFPIYELHIILLAYIVFEYGKANIYTLFPAGMLFGMYEAYITKVIWHPPWAESPHIAGISLLSFPVLVFFWHPFISFITPLLVGESLLTNSREILSGFPRRVREFFESRKNVFKYGITFSIIAGLFLGSSVKNPVVASSSSLFSGLFVLILILLWRNFIGEKYSIRELLPRRRGVVVYLILISILYIIFGETMRREYLPPVEGQIGVWVVYILVFALLIFNLRKSRKIVKIENIVTAKFSLPITLLFIVIFSLFSFFASLLPNLNWIFILGIWILGVAYGIKILIQSVIYAVRRECQKRMAPPI